MKNPLWNCLSFLCCLVLILLFSCSSKPFFIYQTDAGIDPVLNKNYPYPETNFIVISDTHLYDNKLGITGKAFKDYIDNDRKLLSLSSEILDTAVKQISKETADFVLVCGDLTKDGETVSHRGVVKALEQIQASGKKVYVVPGNHDIDNPEAVRFVGDNTEQVPTVTAKEFKKMYAAFGYGDALDQDQDSLSYIAEPVKGLWLLALDSCQWKKHEKSGHPITEGAFSQQTLSWIEQSLIRSKKERKAVIVMVHHGIMEHYPANEKYYGQYIVDDAEHIARMLAHYGVRIAFTGHFHAQDVTKKEFKKTNQFIFDVETGSLATFPCPYRKVKLSQGRLATINSKFITSIPSKGDAFGTYASKFVFDGTITMANAKLDKYKVSKEQQPLITSQIAKAYTAHLKGDEQKPEIIIDKEGFGLWLSFIAYLQKDLIKGWWTDLPPKDNDLVIDLKTGRVATQ
ncbi:MAG: hypothetical protein GY729_01415 [Desulfobacteraceae bacterium]|nr:hypothetical protein [Desulfobacteraceae bacterium]